MMKLRINPVVAVDLKNIREYIAEDNEELAVKTVQEIYIQIENIQQFPYMGADPIQYYIDLIDGFLPQNGDIFPIKAWKRRLDHIESHLEDIDKKIIDLDSASARKDIIDITRILTEIDYNFISEDDLKHIINGIIMPSFSNKNRIEDTHDICTFIEKTLELFFKRAKDIGSRELQNCLIKIIEFLSSYGRKIEKENIIRIYNDVLEICRIDKDFEPIELMVLGMKSEVSCNEEKIELRKQIIERGMRNIQNKKIARLVMVAFIKQVKDERDITIQQKKIMEGILQQHENNLAIHETYYRGVMEFYDEGIPMETKIDTYIQQIIEKNVPSRVLLYARYVQCKLAQEMKERIEIAKSAIEEYDYNEIQECKECIAYVFLLRTLIGNIIALGECVDRKYIDQAVRLCNKDESCHFVLKFMIDAIDDYIESINSQFEKRELCKKVADICIRKEAYANWIYFSKMYIDYVDEQEREEYLSGNEKCRLCLEADKNVSLAIAEYIKHNINTCKDLLLDASEVFDRELEGKYNPALINICFMARRGEIPELEISVLDVLNKITWMGNDAVLNINKALSHIMCSDWESAREEIKKMDSDISSAIQWWNREDVVGKTEKYTVLLLLLLEDKIDENIEEIEIDEVNTEEFWQFCIENVLVPDEMQGEIKDLQKKYFTQTSHIDFSYAL